jgi:hypothetical protein
MNEDALPQTGSWPTPIYGELGVLAEEDGKAQCHICGRWFGNMGQHVVRGHQISCDEYRAYFGLSRDHSLAGKSFRDTQRQNHEERLRQYARDGISGVTKILAQTPEERSAINKSRKHRLSTIKNNAAYQKEHSHVFVQRMIAPDVREKASKTMSKIMSEPEMKKKYSERWKAIPSDKKNDMQQKAVQNAHTPEALDKLSKSMKKSWELRKHKQGKFNNG